MDFGRFRKTQGTPLCFAIFMIFDHFRSTIQTLLGWVWRVSTKPRGAHLATRWPTRKKGPACGSETCIECRQDPKILCPQNYKHPIASYAIGLLGESPSQTWEQARTQVSRFIFQRSVSFWVVCSPPHYFLLTSYIFRSESLKMYAFH